MIPTKLQLYVLREALKVAAISIVALTAMMFVGMSVSLMRGGLSVVQLADLVPYVMAMSLPYALPSAFLLATVFVFGRLSGQNEITAMKSSGVNLNHVIVPLLVLGLLVSGVTFGLNHYLLPWSLSRIKVMRDRLLTEIVQMVGASPREYPVGKFVIYVGGIEERTNVWLNVAVIQFERDFPATVIMARRATCLPGENPSVVILRLSEGTILKPMMSEGERQPPVRFQDTSYVIDLTQDVDLAPERPKFLMLPRLWGLLGKLGAAASEIRSDPAFAHIRHPKTERKLCSRQRNMAYQAYSSAQKALSSSQADVKVARDGAESAEKTLQSARAEVAAAAGKLQELQDSLQRQQELRQNLFEEHKGLIDRNGEPDRIETQRKELENLALQIDSLEKRAAEARLDVDRAAAAMKAGENTLSLRTAALDRVETRAADLRAKADNARAIFEVEQKRIDNLKALEEDLRARTDFHFRNAGALTVLVFMLIGIPLGILSRHGNIILAFVISFFAVLIVYYPLMVMGQMLSTDGFLSPLLGGWMGNFVVGGAGLVLLTRGVRR